MYGFTLMIIVFCRPTLSATIPMMIRETLFTALFKARSSDPVEDEYARTELE